MRDFLHKRVTLLLALVFALSIARLWIVQLPVSFWTDEMVTVFVVHEGAHHPSLAIAPQVSQSIYYRLASLADRAFGITEVGYRIPSILAMGLALFLIARLAARLIHPDAAWFAVFACLGLKGLNYEATDARPYALGMCVSAAALLFLVRWLDSNQWLDVAGFLIPAALLWRVHLTYWPFYFVFAIYAILRLARRDTPVVWPRVLLVFAALALALLPVARAALVLLRQAQAHVIMPPPTPGDLTDALKWKLLLATFAVAGLLDRFLRWTSRNAPATWYSISAASACLILSWWLIHPVTLFAFSKITGDSIFINRYLSLTLPGAAMAATLAAALFIPKSGPSPYWKFTALVFGAGVLLTVGNWRHPWTAKANSDWRGAARAVNENSSADTPVICLSPFIEAQTAGAPPMWNPDYPLPGFFYSYLPVYPVRGRTYLFPFGDFPEAEDYARRLAHETLPQSHRFLLYGRDLDTKMWTAWFEKQPELLGWASRHLGKFGDVDAVVMEAPR